MPSFGPGLLLHQQTIPDPLGRMREQELLSCGTESHYPRLSQSLRQRRRRFALNQPHPQPLRRRGKTHIQRQRLYAYGHRSDCIPLNLF